MINAAGDTNYRLSGFPVSSRVITVDGHYVDPLDVREFGSSGGGYFWLGVAQRVDILIPIAQYGNPMGGLAVPAFIRAVEESVAFDTNTSLSTGLLLYSDPNQLTDPALLPPSYSLAEPESVGFWRDQSAELKLHAHSGLSRLWERVPQFDRVLEVNLTGHAQINGHRYWEYPALPLDGSTESHGTS